MAVPHDVVNINVGVRVLFCGTVLLAIAAQSCIDHARTIPSNTQQKNPE